MDGSIAAVIAGASAAYAGLAFLLMALGRRRRAKRLERAEDERLVSVIRHSAPPQIWADFWARWSDATDPADRRKILVEFMPSQWQPEPPVGPTPAAHESSERAASAIEARVEAIEKRLPASDTVSLVSSANEARMAVLIEHLERDLAQLSDRTLTRGDVVTSVLGVLGTLGALLAITTWALGRIV